jgi:hypothetical protein
MASRKGVTSPPTLSPVGASIAARKKVVLPSALRNSELQWSDN